MNMNDAPLWVAIQLLKKARSSKAHPDFIVRLEARVSWEAQKAVELLYPKEGTEMTYRDYIKAKYCRNFVEKQL